MFLWFAFKFKLIYAPQEKYDLRLPIYMELTKTRHDYVQIFKSTGKTLICTPHQSMALSIDSQSSTMWFVKKNCVPGAIQTG
jgi:hypothetical protein